MRFIFALILSMSICADVASNSNAETQHSSPLSLKSVSSLQIHTSFTRIDAGGEQEYTIEATALELSRIKNVKSRWAVPKQVHILSEQLSSFKNGIWTATLVIRTQIDNPRIVVQFEGTTDNTPVGISEIVRLQETSATASRKTIRSLSKPNKHSFPEHVHF